jgi:hypothetical protein
MVPDVNVNAPAFKTSTIKFEEPELEPAVTETADPETVQILTASEKSPGEEPLTFLT